MERDKICKVDGDKVYAAYRQARHVCGYIINIQQTKTEIERQKKSNNTVKRA